MAPEIQLRYARFQWKELIGRFIASLGFNLNLYAAKMLNLNWAQEMQKSSNLKFS